MIPSIPELDALQVVELERLFLHEAHDPRRLSKLRERVAVEKVQANPVISSAISGAGGDFLVLDGAHRVHALRELGCELALIQTARLPEEIGSWQHLLGGAKTATLNDFKDSRISEDPQAAGDDFLAEIEASGGERFAVNPDGEDLSVDVETLWRLQELYSGVSGVTRVEPGERVALSDGETLVRYRSFSAEELVEMVAGEMVLPAGITRFHVPRRVLGVRFPLELLKGDPATANARLKSLVEERSRENRIRRYDEPVVLFE